MLTRSDPLSAGVIENPSTVVASVKGMIATDNVVCELETTDTRMTSAETGVMTDGTGLLMSETEGAELSILAIYWIALDWTAVGIRVAVVATI